MRLFSLLTATALVFSNPLSAQFLTSQDCGAVEEQVTVLLDASFGLEVTQSPTSTATATAQGCRVTDLDVYVEDLRVTYRVARLTFLGAGLMDWVRGDVVLPATLDLLLEDAALASGETPPADLGWIAPLRAETITARATWDGASARFRLLPLQIDLGDGNTVTLALDGVAPQWTPNDYRGDFAPTSISLDIYFNGLFEQAVVPPLEANGVEFTPASGPFMSAMAAGLMANAPVGLIVPDAQANIVAFIGTLPAPRGALSLTLNGDAPFLPSRLLAELRTGVPFDIVLPDDLSVGALWTPAY